MLFALSFSLKTFALICRALRHIPILIALSFSVSLWANSDASPSAAAKTAQLVIIIDDLGNNLARGRRAVELPGALTYAILPHTPLAKKLAFYATQLDDRKEVIIHMPMASMGHKHLGPGGLETHYDQQTFAATLQDAFAAVPFAKGLSNHMGSKLTAMPDRMQWLMTELRKTDFYFIDSRTTGSSTASRAANQNDIPYLSRDVFLDHDPVPVAIDKAYRRALQLARENGIAVIIAHPYATTLDFLEKELPRLAETGVNLIPASEAIALQNRGQFVQSPSLSYSQESLLADKLQH